MECARIVPTYFHVELSRLRALYKQGLRFITTRRAQQTSSNKSRVYCANAREFHGRRYIIIIIVCAIVQSAFVLCSALGGVHTNTLYFILANFKVLFAQLCG